VTILLALYVVVGFCDREYSAKLIFELVDTSGVITLLSRVSLSRREISVSYAPLFLDVVMLFLVGEKMMNNY
jgi:hypothetical protein